VTDPTSLPDESEAGPDDGSHTHDADAGAPEPLPIPTPEKPLGDIALSLSGGGYRAAGFHLGVLGMLERVGLLGSVAALSTVSGGSIVGAAWVTSVLDGDTFASFRERFGGFLLGTNVIRQALCHLADNRRGAGATWPSLIRSAAEQYASPGFMGDRRFAALYDERLPLREVIFNATEFRTGVAFRFRRSRNPLARIGNGSLPVPRRVADHVRLADVVAASSCFPGAFEPFRFPDDFTWPADFPVEAAREELGPKFAAGLPLMDGGIYDNQGISSLLLAYHRGGAATLLACDTSPRNPDLYPTPAPHARGFVPLRLVRWLGIALFLLALLSFGALLVEGCARWTGSGTDWLLYVVPGVLSAGTAGGLLWLRRRIRAGIASLRRQVHVGDVWNDVRGLTVAEAEGLADLRLTSLLALTSSVFMARIRSLVYRSLYEDPRFEHRRMACLIYSLEESRPALFAAHPWLRPSPELVRRAAEAEKMPTTLWFDAPDQLATLEAVGAATCCFILLKFVLEDRAAEAAHPGSPVALLLERLKAEWAVLNGNPPSPA
jgi:predicted acylesterase/phospholipase RssA